MKVELTDAQWSWISRSLPKPVAKPKGGRPRADDRACMEGIRWILRTNAWLHNFRRLITRYDHKLEHYRAFLYAACMLITLRKL